MSLSQALNQFAQNLGRYLKRRDKDTTFGESAEIRVLESGKKEEAQTIVDHIKELCHD